MKQYFRNNSILYVCTSEVAHIMVGRYKSEETGQITIAYEMKNPTAVQLICQNKDFKKANEQDLQNELTAILRDVVRMARVNGVNVEKIISDIK